MPFTYSIANGISAGIVSSAAFNLLSGRPREAHPVVDVLAALLWCCATPRAAQPEPSRPDYR